MKVVCVSKGDMAYLTIGKIYESLVESKNDLLIEKNDLGTYMWYKIGLFKTVEQVREIK